MTRRAWFCAALVAALWNPAVLAGTTVIYRCTDAAGAVTFQNGTACPAGHAQERRIVEMAAPIPAFVAPPAKPDVAPQVPLISQFSASDTAPATPGADDVPVPPPALFACRVYDNSTYWREDDTPPLRCRPMQTVGIGGLPGMGAGQACEQVADVCEAVPEDGLCRAWDARVREAEFRWQYAKGRERDALRHDYELLYSDYAATTCLR